MNIIILNGPSSSGKTSIGKHIQEIMNDNYVMLGLDNIIYTMPKRVNDYAADMQPRDGFYWIADLDKNGAPLMHLTAGAYGQKIYKILIAQVKFFADSGLNVIVDHVALTDDYLLWFDTLIDHNVIFCGTTAKQEILDQREKERGDRVIGGSRAQMMKVNNGYEYDIYIDTSSITPVEAAKQICELVESKRRKIFTLPLRKKDIPTIFFAFNNIGWNKPASIFEEYLKEIAAGKRLVWVAHIQDEFAGYITLKWQSRYPFFKGQNIPEIMDLNVLPHARKIGIGSLLLDTAEKEAVTRSDTVGIGVGLYGGEDGGYGSAQRLYVKRGYIPDGKGVTYNYQPTIPGNSYPLDDDLVLWLTKKLR